MNKDYLLLGIVTTMSIAANLPDKLISLNGFDRKLLVLGLLLVVTIALVRYSKFALVLAVGILAIGGITLLPKVLGLLTSMTWLVGQ